MGAPWADRHLCLCYLLAVTLTHPLIPDSPPASQAGVEKVPNPTEVVTTMRIAAAVLVVAGTQGENLEGPPDPTPLWEHSGILQ